MEKRKSIFEQLEQAKTEEIELFAPTKEWVNNERPLSPSSLKAFRNSPMHYLEYLEKKFVPSPALILGGAIDKMILEPNTFEDDYDIMPKYDRRTKKGKADHAEFFANIDRDKTYITEEQYYTALACAKSVYRNKDAMYYIERITKTQKKLKWKDPQTGLMNTGYVDAASDPELKDAFILELKSTRDASQYGFIREAHNLDYIMQGGGYTLGYKHQHFEFPDFIFLTVETSSPYPVNVHRADGRYIQAAQQEYLNTLLAFDYCMSNNEWGKTYDFFRFNTPYHRMELPGYFRPKFG